MAYELWADFAQTYRRWSELQKDPDSTYAVREVAWLNYVAARDAYLGRPRQAIFY